MTSRPIRFHSDFPLALIMAHFVPIPPNKGDLSARIIMTLHRYRLAIGRTWRAHRCERIETYATMSSNPNVSVEDGIDET